MKVMTLLPLLLFSLTANAGPYLELGIGYLRDVPVEAQSEVYVENELNVRLEEQATVRIDSPFTRLSLGWRFPSTNMHVELRYMGILDDADQRIKSLEIYKRWEYDI